MAITTTIVLFPQYETNCTAIRPLHSAFTNFLQGLGMTTFAM